MRYPEEFIGPMRQELTRLGVQETRTPEDVDAMLGSHGGTVIMMVISASPPGSHPRNCASRGKPRRSGAIPSPLPGSNRRPLPYIECAGLGLLPPPVSGIEDLCWLPMVLL